MSSFHPSVEKPQLSGNKIVFVDLDETLFHTRFFRSFWHANASGLKFDAVLDLDDGIYAAQLRVGAIDLLTALRALTQHVYVLTSSIKQYARGFNDSLNLGFKPEHIISREQLEKRGSADPLPDFANLLEQQPLEVYLIDNLPSFDNYKKTRLLFEVFGRKSRAKYIRVEDFLGGSQEECTFEPLDVKYILEEITGVIAPMDSVDI